MLSPLNLKIWEPPGKGALSSVRPKPGHASSPGRAGATLPAAQRDTGSPRTSMVAAQGPRGGRTPPLWQRLSPAFWVFIPCSPVFSSSYQNQQILLNKYLLSAYCMPSTVWGAGNAARIKQKTSLLSVSGRRQGPGVRRSGGGPGGARQKEPKCVAQPLPDYAPCSPSATTAPGGDFRIPILQAGRLWLGEVK